MKGKNNLRKWYLRYFDWNSDGEVNWWEFLIPFALVLGVEGLSDSSGVWSMTNVFTNSINGFVNWLLTRTWTMEMG